MATFKYIIVVLALALGVILLSHCNPKSDVQVPDGNNPNPTDWLIPQNEIYDGGPGKDGIPALENPAFVTVEEALEFMRPNFLVVGVKIGDEARAYPHIVLDWHEVVNDVIGDRFFTLSYCPLTGSAVTWDAIAGAVDKTFGVSGLLYNSNLILYDRETDGNWSQMKFQCVNGELIGDVPTGFQIVETTWQTWIEMYPDSKVLSLETGFSRPYGQYPYGDYKTSDELLFPVSIEDSSLHKKERVHGVAVENRSFAYPIDLYLGSVQVLNESLEGVDFVVAVNSEKDIAVSFDRKLEDGTVLTFSPAAGALPVIMVDNEGTQWDVFGVALNGPRAGTTLETVRSFNAYWFAWAAFYRGAEVKRPSA
jgi:hypothetical protein